jgi:hypothetical protein
MFKKSLIISLLSSFLFVTIASANCGDRVMVSGKPKKLLRAVQSEIENSGLRLVDHSQDADYVVSVYRNNNADWGVFGGSPAALISRPAAVGMDIQLVDQEHEGFSRKAIREMAKRVKESILTDRYCE